MANADTTTSTPTPTSYIALTTIFTPPSSCASSWSYEPSDFNANPSGLFIQNAVADFDTNCFPNGFEHNGRAEKLGTVQVFSPGWCPDGYSTAIMAPGATTSVTCCQSGFSYTVSSATAGERAGGALAGCISMFSSDETTTVLARPLSTLTPNNLIVTSTLDGASLGEVTMWAQPLTIAYQQRDVSLFSTSSSSSSSSGSPTISSGSASASATSSAAGASQTPSSGDSDSGLSTGAKAGIGIGVALGALAVIGFAAFLLMRRRKRANMAPHTAEYAPQSYFPQEMDGQGMPQEMSHAPDPVAKVSPGKVHELPGSTGHYA